MPQPDYSTNGGYLTATIYSGIAAGPSLAAAPNAVGFGSDVLFQSGPGRLNKILIHQQLTSGQGVLFYDAANPTSGGPFALSGHRVIGVLPPTYAGGLVSGNVPFAFTGTPFDCAIPFHSGLCMSSKSGMPGVTISWTQELGTYQ